MFLGACTTGWTQYKKSCYYFNTEKVDSVVWADARDQCDDVGGHLPIIATDDENKFLTNHLPSNGEYWIGLSSK